MAGGKQTVTTMTLPQFQRTTCACEACKAGCRTMPGMCGIGDVDKITSHVAEQRPELFGDNSYFARENFIKAHFVAGEGAKVGVVRDDGTMQTYDIPTITPRQQPNGECVFYREGLCTIHAVSPQGCALVDTHMSRSQGDEIIRAALCDLIEDQRADGPYYRLWQWLEEKRAIARPRAERQRNFQREFSKVIKT